MVPGEPENGPSAPTIGVLALQGDVREHLKALAAAGARPVPVRRAEELEDLDGIVIPGGESTTIGKLAIGFGLFDPLRKRIQEGLAAYGSCAGMIMLAERLVDGVGGQPTFGGLDICVRRNAFGRQVDSFEGRIQLSPLGEMDAVFIRAPWVEDVGPDVEVLARLGHTVRSRVTGAPPGPDAAGRIVAVRQGNLLATAFHPELTADARVHRLFVEIVKGTRPG